MANVNGSVQGRADAGVLAQTSDAVGDAPALFLINIGNRADNVSPWNPIYPNRRDQQLKQFSRQETMISSAIYTLKTRAQTLNYEVNGPTRAKKYALDLLADPGLGDSLMQLTGKVVDDLLTSDNGAFVEVWRAGNVKDDRSPVIGFGHLDSRQCWRTYDPEYPVIYTNPQTSERHKLHRNQVIMTADNVQPIETARGIGFCATSRVLQWSRVMRDIITYKDEKISGRFTRAIGFVSGMTQNQLKAGLKANDDEAEGTGFVIYKGIPIFAAPGMQAGAEMKMILQDLASIPDGFDFWNDVTLYAYILAWVFGTDARDFWPATTSGATKGDATVQNMKARGKGIGWLIQTLEWIFRQCLPASVTFEYDYTDDEQDMMQAEIQEKRVNILSTLKRDGAIEGYEMRALAIAEGIIDGTVLEGLTPPATSDNTSENAPEATNIDDQAGEGDESDDAADETGEKLAADGERLKKTLADDIVGIKTEAAFARSIRSAVRGLWSDALMPPEFDSALLSAITRGFDQAWTEGAAECGISREDRSEDEQLRLNTEVAGQVPYIAGFRQAIVGGSKANGGKLAPLLARAELWIHQYGVIRTTAKTMACADQKMLWQIGATFDHCDTCLFYENKVYRMSVWKKYLEPLDLLPKGRGLACGGIWHCDCDLVPTDRPVTKGKPPIWKPGKKIQHVHVHQQLEVAL